MSIMVNTDHPTTNKAISLWGVSGQTDILQEECGEVITAISRFRRGREQSVDKLAEEIADVIVCMMSVIPALGIEKAVEEYMDFKINRLKGVIDEIEKAL